MSSTSLLAAARSSRVYHGEAATCEEANMHPRIRRIRNPLLIVLSALFLEVLIHQYHYHVPSPLTALDEPFFNSCQEPTMHMTAPRENAVLVMLSRNSDLEQANKTITSIENSFNRWFEYPIVFLNDEEWDEEFKQVLGAASSGRGTFEVIPKEMWGFPDSVDEERAKANIEEQGRKGFPHGGSEGYHHMCRFYSGKFYDMEPLKNYKWYWRLEPNVDFACSITYDPFVHMAKHNKIYGFTISLWEVGKTCPSLFREMSDWMSSHSITPSSLWRIIIKASYLPFPLRRLMSFLSSRDRYGDQWSLCHYWNNFEIADMEFFRSERYREIFEYLDGKGGFYYERWGDAAVHSLAVAMLLQPGEVHHFEDFGYQHDEMFQCPSNAAGGQLPESEALGKLEGGVLEVEGNPEVEFEEGGVGCRCQCKRGTEGKGALNFPDYCLTRIKKPTMRDVNRNWYW